jgi:hypothetical protein
VLGIRHSLRTQYSRSQIGPGSPPRGGRSGQWRRQPPCQLPAHITSEAPCRQPWGLTEMSLADPDGVRIVLIEVAEEHPLRRDLRSFTPVE